MQKLLTYPLFLVLFFVLELAYFRLALRYKIIDKPNERSSHGKFTIRGGGIIFPLAVIGWFILSGFQAPFFVAGLVLISGVSFVDDIQHLHSRVRFFVQLVAMGLMLYQIPTDLEWYWFPLIFFLLVGTINAYNFMDGINGITGLYSLSVLLPLLWVNVEAGFADQQLFILAILALLVFGYYNFRKKAKCFAGDIGSISIAFIVCFLLINAVVYTGNYIYTLFLLLYGLDAGTTMIFRLMRRENIFEPHRTHFYQYLANEKKWPHLKVSAFYAVIQLLISLVVIASDRTIGSVNSLGLLIVITPVLTAVFIMIRFRVESRERLLSTQKRNLVTSECRKEVEAV